ncbi:putative transcriptional regulator, AraC [Cupriavidus taiwanensis]|uniref:AraC family transcriptional regulator n=1 Tax=Cupriavidus taiwanensis TaxID=164546 RepID=UPI000E0FFD62|nr:AraC family transcriptional regulator [Cupriavidus taiwanensis]SPA43540.1 putative transcriptional regulator, AraC [Cupriavidus taiwanensis]
MPQQEPIQAGPLPRDLLHALREGGYDVSALAPAPESDTDSDSCDHQPAAHAADPQQAIHLLLAVYHATGDPAIGLWLGSRMPPDLLGLAGLPAMAGPSLGTALRRIARYQKLLAGDRVELRRQGDEAWVCIRPSDPEAPDSRPRIDMELCSLLAFGRRFTRKPLHPLRVSLRIGRPAWHLRYTEAFDCPVRFGEPEDAIVFGRRDLALRLMARDRSSPAAPAASRDLRPAAASLGDVRTALQQLAGDRALSLAAVARHLDISERTLQRRLMAAGTSFRTLCEDARRELAGHYLSEGALSLGEIAFRLGFDDANSFFRAFRRWTGMTPGDYRRHAAPAPQPPA